MAAILELDNGWFQIEHSSIRYRVNKNLWYVEHIEVLSDGTQIPYINAKTLLTLFLATHCKTYSIEYSISTMRQEQDLFVNDGILKSELKTVDEWVIPTNSNMASTLVNYDVQFILKYNNIKISNTLGETDYLHDLYVMLNVSSGGIHNISGWREYIQPEHVLSSYIHSHLPSHNYISSYFSTFCTGHSGTPINVALNGLGNAMSYLSRDIKTSPLVSFLNPEITTDSFLTNNFEKAVFKFLSSIPGLITHESLQGVPHIYLRYNYMESSDIPYDVRQQDTIKFAEICCLNIHDKRISYNITNDVIRILDNKDLIDFAKEHGFFYKLFAFPKNTGSNYTMSLTNKKVISEKEIKKISCKLNLLQSPFYWNGVRINSKIYHYKNEINLDDNKAKLHDDIRGVFDSEVSNFFKGRIFKHLF